MFQRFTTCNNWYIKRAANDTKRAMMSGLPLPHLDMETNTVSKVKFDQCTFHADCADVKFVDCYFTGCYFQHMPDKDNFTSCVMN